MKQIIYFISFILYLHTLTGCVNNSDDIEPNPPEPPVIKNLSEEALLGTWEVYVYKKQITANYDTNPSSYSLRKIEYDGFKTVFSKENGKYIARDYNLVGKLVMEADYHIVNDSIKFNGIMKAQDGSDSIVNTRHRVGSFKYNAGVMSLETTYTGRAQGSNVKYKITDTKTLRNVEVAPTTNEGVNPPKVIVDFDDMCKGKWHISRYNLYYDGMLQKSISEERTKILSCVTYKFYFDKDGKKKCTLTEWNTGTNKWYSKDHDVVVIDDIIHILYTEKGEDDAFGIYVTNWQKRNGKDMFVDLKEESYKNDVQVIEKQEWILFREDDDFLPPIPNLKSISLPKSGECYQSNLIKIKKGMMF